jgi:CBS domain-containing protein
MGRTIARGDAVLARDIATTHVIGADVAQSLREAALIMYRHQVRCLVVTDSRNGGKAPVGVLTGGDLAMATWAQGHDADATTIGSVMTQPLVICRDDDTFTELIALMRGSGQRRLPVVDDAGALVGIVTADDVIAAMAELMESLARALIVEPPLNRADR